MEIRLVFASPDPKAQSLLRSLLAAALELMSLHVHDEYVDAREELLARARAGVDDVVVLDWLMAEAETPALVSTLLALNPRLRIVVLLPQGYRQYRQEVWHAGACTSIAKENMEQEWFSSVLCIMHRAMQREAQLHAYYQNLQRGENAEPSALYCSPLCC